MTFYLFALSIGVIAGLRTMTAAAAVSWAAWMGALPLTGTPLAFLGATVTPWIFTVLALGELVADQLPKPPSRKVPVQFGARLLIGAVAGAAIGMAMDNMLTGAGLGLMGALIGTYGGAEARARMAAAFGSDRPAALIEDVVAMAGAALIVLALS